MHNEMTLREVILSRRDSTGRFSNHAMQADVAKNRRCTCEYSIFGIAIRVAWNRVCDPDVAVATGRKPSVSFSLVVSRAPVES